MRIAPLQGNLRRVRHLCNRLGRTGRSRTMSGMTVTAITATAFALLAIGIYQLLVTVPNLRNGCVIPRMHQPEYVKLTIYEANEQFEYLNSKYTLYRHIQPKYVKKNAALKVRGIPVLYLHGNKGHYKEVRSLGYTSDLVADSTKVKKRLEYFTVDFQEEASAFNGAHLQDQSEYVNIAVNAILRLYRKQARGNKEKLKKVAHSVIIIGHSMGGIAATHALSLSSYRQGSISSIITLSSPHQQPPVFVDSALDRVYTDTYNTWSIGSRFIAYNYFLERQAQIEKKAEEANERARKEREHSKAAAGTDEEDPSDEFEPDNLEEATKGNDKDTSKATDGTDVEGSGAAEATKSSSWFSLQSIPVLGYFFQGSSNSSNVTSAQSKRKDAVSSATMFTKKSAHKLRSVALISLSGGLKDNMVDPSATSIAQISTPDKSIGILTKEIPDVELNVDHHCMVWCKQLVMKLNEAIYSAVDPKTNLLHTKVIKRMSAFRGKLMQPDYANAAGEASRMTLSGENRTVPFWHDRIYKIYTEDYGIIPKASDVLDTYFGELLRRYGVLILSMSIGIVLLAFGYQLHMYLPYDGKEFPSLNEALEPEKHLLWIVMGALQNEEMKKAGISDKDFIKGIHQLFMLGLVFSASFAVCEIPAYQEFFEQVLPETIFWGVSLMGRTIKTFSPTTLLPVDQNFPPLIVFGFIYFASLSVVLFILKICLFLQYLGSFLPFRIPSNIREALSYCFRVGEQSNSCKSIAFKSVYYSILAFTCFAIGHTNFEKIEFSDVNSFFILREGGVSFGRFVASTIIMLQLGTYAGLLEILVFKTASRGGNADLDHFRLSVGILLLLVLPFQGSTFLKAVNTIQALDRGYARAIYDLTICLVQSLGLYLLSQSAQILPARCSKQLKSGNKMYYGIEIGPYGPTHNNPKIFGMQFGRTTFIKN